MSLVLFSSLIFGLMAIEPIIIEDTMAHSNNDFDGFFISNHAPNTDEPTYLVHDGKRASTKTSRECSLDPKCSFIWYIHPISPDSPLCPDGACSTIQTIKGPVPPALTLNDETDNNGHLHPTKGQGSWFILSGDIGNGLVHTELFNVHLNSINKNPLLCYASSGTPLGWSPTTGSPFSCEWMVEPNGCNNCRSMDKMKKQQIQHPTPSRLLLQEHTMNNADILDNSNGYFLSTVTSRGERLNLVYHGNRVSAMPLTQCLLNSECSFIWYIDRIYPNNPLCDGLECSIIKTMKGAVPPALTLNDRSDSGNGPLLPSENSGSWFIISGDIHNDDVVDTKLLNVHLNSMENNPFLCVLTFVPNTGLIPIQRWLIWGTSTSNNCEWSIESNGPVRPIPI